MKRITSLASLLLLACLLFTSCTKYKIFENYNNIPDFEIESWGSGRYRIGFSERLTFGFKFYWDAATKRDFPPYDDLLINIYSDGFDFKFRIVDQNGKRQTEEIFGSDSFSHNVSALTDRSSYYKVLGERSWYEYGIDFHTTKREPGVDRGCIAFEFVTTNRKTGKRFSAKYHVYYASNDEYIAYSQVSVADAIEELNKPFPIVY